MKYHIERFNGQGAREADSLAEAMKIARSMCGVARLYKGSQYVTDYLNGMGDQESCEALDLWIDRANAKAQMSRAADVVLSWGR